MLSQLQLQFLAGLLVGVLRVSVLPTGWLCLQWSNGRSSPGLTAIALADLLSPTSGRVLRGILIGPT